jgi:hypothetical protein
VRIPTKRRRFDYKPNLGLANFDVRIAAADRVSSQAVPHVGTRLASYGLTGSTPARRTTARMIIDDETFTQIALHIRRASDGLLGAARQMAVLCDPENEHEIRRDGLTDAVESLVSMNEEFIVLERILRAVWEANRYKNELPS